MLDWRGEGEKEKQETDGDNGDIADGGDGDKRL